MDKNSRGLSLRNIFRILRDPVNIAPPIEEDGKTIFRFHLEKPNGQLKNVKVVISDSCIEEFTEFSEEKEKEEGFLASKFPRLSLLKKNETVPPQPEETKPKNESTSQEGKIHSSPPDSPKTTGSPKITDSPSSREKESKENIYRQWKWYKIKSCDPLDDESFLFTASNEDTGLLESVIWKTYGQTKQLNDLLTKILTQKLEKLKKDLDEVDKNWLKQLKESPEFADHLIETQIKLILSFPQHQFGNLLPNFVASFRKKHESTFKKKVIKDQQLNELVSEINTFTTGLISVFDQHFDNFLEISDPISFFCHCSIQELLFPQIPEIEELFIKRYREEDLAFEKKISSILTVNLAHLGVSKCLWLVPDDAANYSEPPYIKAFNVLRELPTIVTPHEKLGCLLRTEVAIIECINNFSIGNGKSNNTKTVGADDFIPLFAYVLLKSRVPNIIAESNFMYSFIDQYSTGEKTGYMLVTLQTCIEFLTKLELSQIDESAKKMVQEVRTRRESLKARVRAPSGMSLEALQQFISNQQQQYLEKQNWFHPNISKEESTFILQDEPPNTCLIRASSKTKPDVLYVAISVVLPSKSITHSLIYYDCEKRAYVGAFGEGIFPDLEAFIRSSGLTPLTKEDLIKT